MCVSIINGETDNHTIQEKEPTRNNSIFAMDNSAVILGIRKIIVILLIGLILLAGNILLVANWLAEKGVAEKANWVREHFLTGTVNLLISLEIETFFR